MADAHKNFAYSLVATAPSPASSGTTLVVTAGEGAHFPAVPFNATVWPMGEIPIHTNAEIVRVTDVTMDTLTITRTQESSSARSIVVGDQIAATITAKTLTDAEASLTGGISIASQAALDFIYASSASQLARLAAGSALQAPRINAAGSGWEFATSQSHVELYTPTIANCENTTVETTVLSFTVPGGTWADGERITIHNVVRQKNNKGSAGTMTFRLSVGSSAQVSTAVSMPNSETELLFWREWRLMRVGANVMAAHFMVAYTGLGGFNTNCNAFAELTPTNFTDDNAVVVTCQFSEAHVTCYVRPVTHHAEHFKT